MSFELDYIDKGYIEILKKDQTEKKKIDMSKIALLCDEYMTDYISSIADIDVLTQKRINDIVDEINNGDDSNKQLLINSYLKLVVIIALEYYSKNQNKDGRIPLDDFIQEGNLVVLDVIDDYVQRGGGGYHYYEPYSDRSRIMGLTTFIKYILRDSMIGLIYRQDNIIELGSHDRYLLGRIVSTANELEERKQENSYNNISRKTGLKVNTIISLLSAGADEINYDKEIPNPDTEDFENETIYFKENISNKEDEVIKEVESDELRLLINKLLLDKLTNAERNIITLRFGLNGTQAFDTKMLAAEFNIREIRVTQILNKAIRKLRYHGAIRLVDFK